MSSFKALVIKDLLVNKKALMVPIWYVLGSYVLVALSTIFASTTSGNGTTISGIPLDLLQNNSLHVMMSFIIQAGMFFGFLSFIFAISMSATASTMLSQDIKQKCELFHRSQPVSIWQITASRFVAGIGGPIALSFIIGVVNMLLSFVVIGIMTPMRIDLWMSLNGFMLSWLHASVALLVFGSVLFLFSGMFKENSWFGLAGLGGLQVIAFFLNKIYGWHLPYVLNVLSKLIMSGILNIQKVLPTEHQFGIVSVRTQTHLPDVSKFVIPDSFLYNLWTTLFTWDIALKIVLCVVMYVIATCFYHRREVQF